MDVHVGDHVVIEPAKVGQARRRGEVLEICRVQAPERGLSVAEAQPDGGFTIETPNEAFSSAVSGASVDEHAREHLVVRAWANRAGTYQLTYWACDTKHLTPATVDRALERRKAGGWKDSGAGPSDARPG